MTAKDTTAILSELNSAVKLAQEKDKEVQEKKAAYQAAAAEQEAGIARIQNLKQDLDAALAAQLSGLIPATDARVLRRGV